MIQVETLQKHYPDAGRQVHAVDGLSFQVPEGELYTLLGPSGCGKTTTLRCVAGLERPDGGRIVLGDTVVYSDRAYVPTYQRDIGMVFQSYAIWPHMTVYENAAYPLRVDGKRHPRREVEAAVDEALDLVGLAGYEDRMATQLSGGQQQRLSLARALVRRPRVLLLDEPLSNLDAKLREHMRQEIRLLQRRLRITTLFVTHDQVEALSMSDRVAVLRDGRIVQEGTPQEIYLRPTNDFVAQFVGATNLLPGTVVAVDAAGVRVATEVGEVLAPAPDLPGDGAPGGAGPTVGAAVTVTFRPEDVELVDDPAGRPNTWPVEVLLSSFTGAVTDFRVTAGGTELMVRVPSRTATRGRTAYLHAPADVCRILPGAAEPVREAA